MKTFVKGDVHLRLMVKEAARKLRLSCMLLDRAVGLAVGSRLA